MAWIAHGDRTWAARPPGHRRWSAVVELVQGVRELCADADLVLRRPIATTGAVTRLDAEVVRVAARRVREASGPAPIGPEVTWVDAAAATARARAVAVAVTWAPDLSRPALDVAASLVVPPPDDTPLRHRDRPTAAVLVGPDGRAVIGARNLSGRNRTLHAEAVIVQAVWARDGGIAAGSTLYSVLQPCRMCAAWVVAASAGPVRVVYREPDPGRFARGTCLQHLGWEAREEGRRGGDPEHPPTS